MLMYSWNIIKCVDLNSIIWWALIYVYTCENISTIKNMKISISSFPIVFCWLFIISSCYNSHLALGNYSPTLVTVSFVFIRILYKWNHAICIFFCFSSLFVIILICIHVVGLSLAHSFFISGYCYIICLSIHLLTVKFSCCENSCLSICIEICLVSCKHLGGYIYLFKINAR